MIALHLHQVESASLIQALESYPVLGVERRLSERKDDGGLARNIEFKVRGLPGLHHAVLVVFDHHEVLQRGEVDGVGGVLVRLLVVDLRNKLALLDIGLEMERVVPILGLDKEVLDKVNIGSIVEKIPDVES